MVLPVCPMRGLSSFWQLQAKRSRKVASVCNVFLMFKKLVLQLVCFGRGVVLPSRTNLGSKIGGCKKIDCTLGILDWKSALQSAGNQYSLNVKNWKSQKMDSTCPFLRLFSVIFLSLAGVPVIADGVLELSEGRTRF